MTGLPTCWLPHLPARPARPLPGPAGEAGLTGPELTAADLEGLAVALREARRRHLAGRTVGQILEVLDTVAARWQDPAYPLRRLALEWMPRLTGYAPAMVEAGLAQQTQRAAGGALRRLLAAELSDQAALDQFVQHPGGSGLTRAFGPDLCGFVFSGNVPGIPAFHLAVGLTARAACLAKTASGEPLFAALWCRSLAEADPALGQCVAAAYWPGASSDLHRAAFGGAGALVAFGSDPSLRQLAAALPPEPAGPRLVRYGSRLSLAAVAREALSPAALPALAAAVARDVAMFDQQGCVSPHAVWTEGDAEALAGALAAALAEQEARWPRAPLRAEEAAAIQLARGEFRFAPGCRVWASPGSTAWTVVLAPPERLQPAPLNRFVFVHPVNSLAELPQRLAPWSGYLQTCGFAGPPDRGRELAAALAPLGLSRLAPLGRAQEPAPQWRHDGQPVLLPLLHWVDIEEE